MRIPRVLQPGVDLIKELASEFSKANGSLIAAAVSFYIFLSLAPLLLLAAAVLGYILGTPDRAYNTIVSYLPPALARSSGPELRTVVLGIVHQRGAATGFGLVSLFWAGSQAFINLGAAMNIAWDTRPRRFLMRYLVAFGLLVGVGILLLVSFGITTTAEAIEHRHVVIQGLSLSRVFGSAWHALAFLVPLAISITTFTLEYKVLPNTRVALRSALVGGAAAGCMWEAAKYGFSWYVTRIAHYNAVYGSLAGIVLLLIWIYYSSVVTLLGGQIAAIYNRRRHARAPSSERRAAR